MGILPKYILVFLFIISYITHTHCASENNEKSDQQTRLDACIKILKARIAKDHDYFNEVVEIMTLASESKEDAGNKLISLSLLNCYKKISYYDAEDIESSTTNKIDPMSSESKEKLDFEKWELLFKSNDKEEIESEFLSLEEVTHEIKESKLDLSALQQRPNNPDQESGQRQSNEYDERMDDIYINRKEKNMDFNIFGFNFTTLENKTKYVLGISLIALVFLAVIFGLKWIERIRNQSKWNKKKKKK